MSAEHWVDLFRDELEDQQVSSIEDFFARHPALWEITNTQFLRGLIEVELQFKSVFISDRDYLERFGPDSIFSEWSETLEETIESLFRERLDVLPQQFVWLNYEKGVKRKVGRYTLERCVGQGGFGTVFKAFQDDTQLPVALKIINACQLTPSMQRRFRDETQYLTRFQHENIVKIIDGGILPLNDPRGSSFPYLVMEWLEGEALDAFCASRKCTVKERIELFIKICRGVQYFAVRNIVHRDIKPQNVIVVGDKVAGQNAASKAGAGIAGFRPIIIDFGAAKGVLGAEVGTPVHETTDGEFIGSKPYASPEHLDSSRAANQLSDVYSLGSLLYQLLTGTPPVSESYCRNVTPTVLIRELQNASRLPPSLLLAHQKSADLRTASEGSKRERPSSIPNVDLPRTVAERKTTDDVLVATLKGDLDSIVLKAISYEPEDRYKSAGDLADDLQRWLDNEVVLARKRPGVAYRFSKYVRRRKANVLLMFVASIASILALVMLGMSWRESTLRKVEQLERKNAVERELLEAGKRLLAEDRLATLQEREFVGALQRVNSSIKNGHLNTALRLLSALPFPTSSKAELSTLFPVRHLEATLNLASSRLATVAQVDGTPLAVAVSAADDCVYIAYIKTRTSEVYIRRLPNEPDGTINEWATGVKSIKRAQSDVPKNPCVRFCSDGTKFVILDEEKKEICLGSISSRSIAAKVASDVLHEEELSVFRIQWTPDGKAVAVSSNRNSDRNKIEVWGVQEDVLKRVNSFENLNTHLVTLVGERAILTPGTGIDVGYFDFQERDLDGKNSIVRKTQVGMLGANYLVTHLALRNSLLQIPQQGGLARVQSVDFNQLDLAFPVPSGKWVNLAISGNERVCAIASTDGEISIFNIENDFNYFGRSVNTILVSGLVPNAIAFSTDTKSLYVAATDGRISVLNTVQSEAVSYLKKKTTVTDFAVTATGFKRGGDAVATILDPNTGKNALASSVMGYSRWKAPANLVNRRNQSRDSYIELTKTSVDPDKCIVHSRSRQQDSDRWTRELNADFDDFVLSHDKSLLYLYKVPTWLIGARIRDFDDLLPPVGKVTCLSTSDGVVRWSFSHQHGRIGWIAPLAKELIIAPEQSDRLKILDEKGQVTATLQTPSSKCIGLTTSADSKWIAAIFSMDSDVSKLCIWENSTRELYAEFQLPSWRLFELHFSPNGESLLIGPVLSNSIHVIDQIGESAKRLEFSLADKWGYQTAAFESDNSLLIAASTETDRGNGSQLCRINLRSDDKVQVLQELPFSLGGFEKIDDSLVFNSIDGVEFHLVNDQAVKFFEMNEKGGGAEGDVYQNVVSLAASPDDSTVLGITDDKAIIVFDSQTQKVAAVYRDLKDSDVTTGFDAGLEWIDPKCFFTVDVVGKQRIDTDSSADVSVRIQKWELPNDVKKSPLKKLAHWIIPNVPGGAPGHFEKCIPTLYTYDTANSELWCVSRQPGNHCEIQCWDVATEKLKNSFPISTLIRDSRGSEEAPRLDSEVLRYVSWGRYVKSNRLAVSTVGQNSTVDALVLQKNHDALEVLYSSSQIFSGQKSASRLNNLQVTAMALTPNGKELAVARQSGSIEFHSVDQKALLYTINDDSRELVTAIEFSPNCEQLFVQSLLAAKILLATPIPQEKIP